jgi:hypothetical protein
MVVLLAVVDKCSKLQDLHVSGLNTKSYQLHDITGSSGSARSLGRRTLATVQDTPVRRYGGLKDQDRIFTNAYLRHDHGIKGALVRHLILFPNPCPYLSFSLVVIGIRQKISS